MVVAANAMSLAATSTLFSTFFPVKKIIILAAPKVAANDWSLAAT
jgi:hypothetical protein